MSQEEHIAGDEGTLQRCPIPRTHRRLRHTHELWHQALQSYHTREKFDANLNATIQALRSVTLMLQNEKAVFPNFDEWYGPWQQKLKDDTLSKWLNDARVTVFHVGDLDSYSSAEVKLITWRQEVLSTVSIPIQTPAQLILENPALLNLLDTSKSNSADLEDGFLTIERRWSTKDLRGKELLVVLAHVYGLIADLVLDAHTQLGRMNCISASEEHQDFPSSHDRTGVLRCVVASVEARTERFRASTRERLVASAELDYSEVDSAEVAMRYGFDNRMPKVASGGLDPLTFAKKLQFIAKRMLRRDKHHAWMMFIRDGRGSWHNITLSAKDRTEKYVVMQLVAQFVEAQGADAVIDIGEVWTVLASKAVRHWAKSVEDIPGREEALAVMVVTRGGLSHWFLTPIKRGPLGGIKLEDTVEVEKRLLPYFEPVIEVWRKQMEFRAQDGTRSRVWEPDILDLCPCGGPERYGLCCRFSIAKLREAKSVSSEEQRAAGDYDPTVDEARARASLARYVIWIKQHTAEAMEAGHSGKDFYDKIVQIDALALQSHIDLMMQALKAVGKSDLVLPQLHRLRELVGVPRLAMRITALASSWLFECGRPEEAVLELDALGDPFELKDSLALSLVARHFDLSDENKKRVLLRAMDQSTYDEERHVAKLSLATHLFTKQDVPEAESLVRSILKETEQDKSSSERSAALILLWRITGRDEDFRTVTAEIDREGFARHCYRNASFLIEGGKYEEAVRLLESLVASGDVEAKLLTFDAKLRVGNSTDARELFTAIDSETLLDILRFPYAAAMAHLVLVGGFSDLSERAISLLASLPEAGGEQDKQVKLLMNLLRGGPVVGT